MQKRGLVLVVGATGSGKSTSLAAMIDHRNRTSSGHIITIEDPVEYVHESRNCLITHREVGADTHSWHRALRNTLRQAPDVILIGEIRDAKTMEHALAFAETGHPCAAATERAPCARGASARGVAAAQVAAARRRQLTRLPPQRAVRCAIASMRASSASMRAARSAVSSASARRSAGCASTCASSRA